MSESQRVQRALSFASIKHNGQKRKGGEDYIIQGIHGELYPCRRKIFLESYVPAISHKYEEDNDGVYD